MGAELFHADGQTDGHDEANSRFFAILRTRLIMGDNCENVMENINIACGKS